MALRGDIFFKQHLCVSPVLSYDFHFRIRYIMAACRRNSENCLIPGANNSYRGNSCREDLSDLLVPVYAKAREYVVKEIKRAGSEIHNNQ